MRRVTTSEESTATRRTVLCGAALAALGLTAAACGGGGESDGSSPEPTTDKPVELGAADAVPVGGAKLYADQKVLVSQPEKGDFKAFSAVCTHQGSTLDRIDGEVAVCPLHGSRFQVDSGKVAKGPATTALPSMPVKVEKGKLLAG
ncbi:Rieske (2Fe-2S) protein [Streptomyces spirodelae]|uniref:Cytochrome bc1 complex Rieske iron-sulfur subunit n=1 Tax=Streptomyces spirodelae TaxID=2812904 RepID=A0ABS3WYS7_9ACTN|nr:Rieske (2Fe-2S) protein [Streptomyces spirodelae]MBO8188290.1 Rieske (2Fe-2S) protein [Streptomyces spirodelae]